MDAVATKKAGPAASPSWQLSTFSELGVSALYAALRLRQEVFVVEQNCAYLDADGRDETAWHLLGWSEPERVEPSQEPAELLAYARILPPGPHHLPVIGRILTAQKARGTGLGHALVDEAIRHAQALFGKTALHIGAQAHLAAFYRAHGFEPSGPPYDEDGIEHIPMLRPP